MRRCEAPFQTIAIPDARRSFIAGLEYCCRIEIEHPGPAAVTVTMSSIKLGIFEIKIKN
jgi:hypothetical protein